MTPEPTELYRKHRPKKFRDVLGQPAAVQLLQKLLAENKLPHCLLFSGPSGTGKTTLARILKNKLGCHDRDFIEINAADTRGIDTVREIHQVMQLAPMWGGKCRIWLIDECGKLTGDAQTALLKTLEDTPAHAYFLLATTDPQKLLKTIRTRVTEIRLQALAADHLRDVLDAIVIKEERDIAGGVLQRIVDCANGSARQAVVLLHQVLALPSTEEQLESIIKEDVDDCADRLVNMMMSTKTTWSQLAQILIKFEGDEEAIRHRILGKARWALLQGKDINRAYYILEVFRKPFYESKLSGLAWACAEVFRTKS